MTNIIAITIPITEDLIYAAVEPYDGQGSIYDVIRNDKIEGNKLVDYSENIIYLDYN